MKRAMVYLHDNNEIPMKQIKQSQADLISADMVYVTIEYKTFVPMSMAIVSSGSDKFADNAERFLWDDEG